MLMGLCGRRGTGGGNGTERQEKEGKKLGGGLAD